MICPCPPTPIFKLDFSGAPPEVPVGAAAPAGEDVLEPELEQPARTSGNTRSRKSLRIILTIGQGQHGASAPGCSRALMVGHAVPPTHRSIQLNASLRERLSSRG